MERNRKIHLIIINDFAHDLFSGFWLSCVIVVYLLSRKVEALSDPSAIAALRDVLETFFWFVAASLAAVIVTGGVRSFTYRPPQDDDKAVIKKKLLIIKHVVLGIVFIGGTWFAYSAAYK